ncbi:hypothetical protein FGIG_07705 [Fasciola gigantica]|uniref:Uncharacterized protein n=1 Tax=Fasciola gigantica TaxID=46835 RepID=A0A504YG23_FASGI|nr:hypothetical protein FGIG_07705 [Fasciola gigantica]
MLLCFLYSIQSVSAHPGIASTSDVGPIVVKLRPREKSQAHNSDGAATDSDLTVADEPSEQTLWESTSSMIYYLKAPRRDETNGRRGIDQRQCGAYLSGKERVFWQYIPPGVGA